MKVVVGDLEANGLLDTATRIWCGVFQDTNTNKKEYFAERLQGREYIYDMLKFLDSVDVLIMHNGIMYDLPLLKKLHGYNFKGEFRDTLLMSRLQNPIRGSHSIEAWGEKFMLRKPKHEDWSKYSDAMLHRCEQDVEINAEVYKALLIEQGDVDWDVPHKVVNLLFRNLQSQKEYGWMVNKEHLNTALKQLSIWKERIRKATLSRLPFTVENLENAYYTDLRDNKIYSGFKKPFKRDGSLTSHTLRYCNKAAIDPANIAGPFGRVNFRPISLDKPSEIKDFLLQMGWKPAEWNFSKQTGKRTTPKLSKDDEFEGVEGRLGKVIVKYAQIKQREGVLNGWKNAIRPDGRIPSVVTDLAVTSRAKHSVIANVPRVSSFYGKQMREVFCAAPGKVLVGADAKGCQLRMLAARIGDANFTREVLEGEIHEANSKRLGIGTAVEAKTFIYALIFGAQDRKVSRIFNCSTQRAGEARRLFLSRIPGLAHLIASETEDWKKTASLSVGPGGYVTYKNGYVTGLDGRRIPVDKAHKVLMGLLQSDEAILMQYAYNILHKKMDKRGLIYGIDWGMCCWYHDEFQAESHPDFAYVLGINMCNSISFAGRYLNIPVEMEGDFTIGQNWAETH